MIRGLAIRISFSQAPFERTQAEADDVKVFACQEAVSMGYADYQQGCYDSPVMFRDTPDLLSSWECGQAYAAESEIIAACPHCNDPVLPCCPIHG